MGALRRKRKEEVILQTKANQVKFLQFSFCSTGDEIQVAITQHFSFINVMEKIGHEKRKSVEVHQIEMRVP